MSDTIRKIVLDTETTGLSPARGHRVIEIGCVELQGRHLTGNNYQRYLQPDRELDAGAVEVHGITEAFLADKPRFIEVVDEFIEFIRGAELVIHNASFDVGFLNHELGLLEKSYPNIEELCQVTDTLTLARNLHPGQRNSLDALCKRYHIDSSARTVHGALLDSEILAEVYLAMTGGQVGFTFNAKSAARVDKASHVERLTCFTGLPVIAASKQELKEHEKSLNLLEQSSGKPALWHGTEDSTLSTV